MEGFSGTETEWLDSLKGADGEPYGNIDGGSPTSIYGGTMTLNGGSV
jgi:hypothetical protein